MINKEKLAIVTGCASGIGKGVVQNLISKGVKVFGLDIVNVDECEYTFMQCDVSNEIDVKNKIEKIHEITDRIDYLVNVAGVLTIGGKKLIKEQEIKQWEEILSVNLNSVLIMMKNTYPLLKNCGSASIVNVSSDQTYKAVKASAPYLVSKVGINALTRLAALEMLEDKIRVNAVALGSVRTNILKSLIDDEDTINNMMDSMDKQLPFGILEPEDAANIICYLLSDQAKHITGQIILADSGKMLI